MEIMITYSTCMVWSTAIVDATEQGGRVTLQTETLLTPRLNSF